MKTNTLDDLALVGDNDALNMINTVVKIDGNLIDRWSSTEQLIYWLNKVAGILVPDDLHSSSALLEKAKELREITRVLIQQKKEGHSLDIEPLNAFLHKASRWLNLEYDANQSLIVTHHYAKHSPEQVLAPLAEATAKLIAQEDFRLVKHCEHKDCVLWFYDKTKAHKRRWCSMKVCGNRHKVMKFRKKLATL